MGFLPALGQALASAASSVFGAGATTAAGTAASATASTAAAGATAGAAASAGAAAAAPSFTAGSILAGGTKVLTAASLANGVASTLLAPKAPKPPSAPKPPAPIGAPMGNTSFFGKSEGTAGGTFLSGSNRTPNVGQKRTVLG